MRIGLVVIKKNVTRGKGELNGASSASVPLTATDWRAQLQQPCSRPAHAGSPGRRPPDLGRLCEGCTQRPERAPTPHTHPGVMGTRCPRSQPQLHFLGRDTTNRVASKLPPLLLKLPGQRGHPCEPTDLGETPDRGGGSALRTHRPSGGTLDRGGSSALRIHRPSGGDPGSGRWLSSVNP